MRQKVTAGQDTHLYGIPCAHRKTACSGSGMHQNVRIIADHLAIVCIWLIMSGRNLPKSNILDKNGDLRQFETSTTDCGSSHRSAESTSRVRPFGLPTVDDQSNGRIVN